MPFWRKETDDEKLQKEKQAACVSALERGDIPPQARERLEREVALGRRFFTSDLTAKEYLLTREAGYETLGQVMGTCFFKIGFYGYYSGYYRSTGELGNVSHAQLHARELAVSRMLQEASILGASGVIGVRLKLRRYDWSAGMVEFTAVGTAVRVPGWDRKEPFASDLNGQEFWQLHQAGYWPRGLAFGVCSYYIHTDYNTRWVVNSSAFWGSGMSNQEVQLYTQGFYNARHLAMSRMNNDVKKVNAQGVVGVTVDYDVEDIEYEINDTVYHDLLVHFIAVGTAVAEGEHPPTRKPALLCYNLSSRTNQELAAID